MIHRKVRAGSAEKQKKKPEGYNQSAGCGKEFGPVLLATAHKESVAFCIHGLELYFPVILDVLAPAHQNKSTDGKNEKEKRNLLTST